MSDIIIPSMPSRDGRLRDFLKGRSPRQFEVGAVMTDEIAKAVQRVASTYGLRNPEVLDGVLTALVSAVQYMAPHTEWAGIGMILSEQITRRLQVEQD